PGPWNGVVLGLRRRGVSAGLAAEEAGEAVEMLGVVLGQPASVVRDGKVAPRGDVHGLDRALEPAPWSGVSTDGARVLLEHEIGIDARLEVRLSQQGGGVPTLLSSVGGDRRR